MLIQQLRPTYAVFFRTLFLFTESIHVTVNKFCFMVWYIQMLLYRSFVLIVCSMYSNFVCTLTDQVDCASSCSTTGRTGRWSFNGINKQTGIALTNRLSIIRSSVCLPMTLRNRDYIGYIVQKYFTVSLSLCTHQHQRSTVNGIYIAITSFWPVTWHKLLTEVKQCRLLPNYCHLCANVMSY